MSKSVCCGCIDVCTRHQLESLPENDNNTTEAHKKSAWVERCFEKRPILSSEEPVMGIYLLRTFFLIHFSELFVENEQ